VLGQHGLDLTQLDAVATNLDLVVRTAQEHQATIRQPADQIPRPVQTRTATERVSHEPLRGQRRTAQITTRQTRTTQVQLPHHTRRHRTQRPVQHIHPRARVRDTDRHHRPARHARTERRVHRRLGGTVRVEHPTARGPACHQLRGHPLGAGQQDRVTREVQVGRQLGQQRGRQDHEVDPVLVRVGRQRLTRHPPLRRDDHQPATGQQPETQVPERHVEARRRELQHPAVRADAEPLDLRRHQFRHPRVRDDDALGAARRAGGVDHVRGAVGRDRDRRVLGRRGREPVLVQCRDHAHRRRVGEHERPAFGGERGVDGEVRRTRLEHGQLGHDHVRRPRDRQGHDAFRTGALVDQQVRQAVRALVQLGVGERPVLADHGDGGRVAADLFGEQVRQGAERGRQCRVVPADEDLVALVVTQEVEPADRAGRPGPRVGDDGVEAPEQLVDEGRVQLVRAVGHGQSRTVERRGDRVIR
jgi:hypothetical protein